MSEFTFSEFIKGMENDAAYYPTNYNLIVMAINKVINDSDVNCFYVKNYMIQNEKLEVQVYTKNNLIMFYELNREVKIVSIDYKEIISTELSYKGEYKPLQLTIKFRNGEVIQLNSEDEMNSSITNQYRREKIEEIFKFLTSNTI